MPIGNPKWRPEVNARLIAFFSIKPYEEKFVVVNSKKVKRRVANDIPFFGAFERKEGLSHGCLSEWAKATQEDGTPKYPGFPEAYKQAKDLQKEFLITNGLLGFYSPAAYCFTARNLTDMRDVAESRLVDKDGNDIISKEELMRRLDNFRKK